MLLLVLAATLVLGGCTFSRTVSNEGVRDLDPSRLEIGKSTWRDVIRELGMPAAATSERVGEAVPSFNYFKYTSQDTRTSQFFFEFWIFIPFRWVDDQAARELFVEFDENGIVKAIYDTRIDGIWRPFEGESSRGKTVTTQRGGAQP